MRVTALAYFEGFLVYGDDKGSFLIFLLSLLVDVMNRINVVIFSSPRSTDVSGDAFWTVFGAAELDEHLRCD